jgi:hypothetical protein
MAFEKDDCKRAIVTNDRNHYCNELVDSKTGKCPEGKGGKYGYMGCRCDRNRNVTTSSGEVQF